MRLFRRSAAPSGGCCGPSSKSPAASGNENRWGKGPKSTRGGRRGTVCHNRRGEVNGQKREKSAPGRRKSGRLGRVGRYVPPRPRFLPEPPQKAGRGKEQRPRADFLSFDVIFQGGQKCQQNKGNLRICSLMWVPRNGATSYGLMDAIKSAISGGSGEP